MRRPLLFLTLAAGLLADSAPEVRAGSMGVGVMFQTAIPTGLLARDVRDQWGFGLAGFGTLGLSDRVLLRPTFSWTGYRINDRNWGNRFLANLLDANSEDEALVLRSLQLGADLVVYRDAGGQGPYAFFGAGLQRSRMSLEHSFTDRQGEEDKLHTDTVADWEPLHTPYLQGGVGLQWNILFVEGKVVAWRYRSHPGTPLMDTPLRGANSSREAVSVVFAAGMRF